MIKYSSIVKMESKKKDKCFKCSVCNLKKYDEIWMKYIIDEREINICGYKCSKIFFDNKPFKLDNVVNKKDFDLPRPVTHICKKDFVILSQEEIDELTDREYIEYNKDLNNYINLNPERAELQLKIQNEMDLYNDNNLYNDDY